MLRKSGPDARLIPTPVVTSQAFRTRVSQGKPLTVLRRPQNVSGSAGFYRRRGRRDGPCRSVPWRSELDRVRRRGQATAAFLCEPATAADIQLPGGNEDRSA